MEANRAPLTNQTRAFSFPFVFSPLYGAIPHPFITHHSLTIVRSDLSRGGRPTSIGLMTTCPPSDTDAPRPPGLSTCGPSTSKSLILTVFYLSSPAANPFNLLLNTPLRHRALPVRITQPSKCIRNLPQHEEPESAEAPIPPSPQQFLPSTAIHTAEIFNPGDFQFLFENSSPASGRPRFILSLGSTSIIASTFLRGTKAALRNGSLRRLCSEPVQARRKCYTSNRSSQPAVNLSRYI